MSVYKELEYERKTTLLTNTGSHFIIFYSVNFTKNMILYTDCTFNLQKFYEISPLSIDSTIGLINFKNLSI